MLTPEQLAAYFENRLEPVERAELERALAEDAAAQYTLADQLNLDLALRVLLGRPAAHNRVKASIFTVLRGAPEASLAASILRDAGGAVESPPQVGFADADLVAPAPHGARTLTAGGAWGRHLVHAWRRLLDSPWRWGVASAAVLVVVVWTLAGLLPTRPAVGLEVGQFSAIVGEPTLAAGSGRTPLPARASTAVHLGDRVETGDADRAELRFHDGTTLRLAFNTTVEFTAPAGQPRARTNAFLRPPEVRLVQGQVWTQVAKRTNAPAYAIRTDAATAIARGTEFGVKLERSSSEAMTGASAVDPAAAGAFATVLTVKEGVVEFTNTFGSVRATAMTESTARADSAPTEPKRLAVLRTAGTDRKSDFPIITSPITGPVAAQRLFPGGGWAGLSLRDLAGETSAPSVTNAALSRDVRVTGVDDGSPAASAGIRPGDRILAINGHVIDRAGEVERRVLAAPDSQLHLRLRRGEDEFSIDMIVADRVSVLPGPILLSREMARLTVATRHIIETNAASGERLVGKLGDGAIRGAAENNLGVMLETSDQLGPAIRAYGRAVRADPAMPLYRFNLGLALRLMGSYERAAEELGEALRLATNSTTARQRFAEIQSLLGRKSQALALTDAALEDDPGSHGLWELKAQLLWRQQRLAEARDAARKAIGLEPSCPVAHGYLGNVLEDQGQLEAAELAYQQSLLHAPLEPSILVGLGRVRQSRGQTVEAEQQYRQAIALQPDFAEAHLQLGLLLGARGNLAGAELSLRRARELVPDSSEIQNNLGEVLRGLGQLDTALACFQRAIELDPDNTAPINNLGILHALRHEYPKAEAAFRTVLERAPELKVPALLNLATTLSEQHKLDASEEVYRQALVTAPNDPAVCNALAFFLAENDRNLDEALELARSAVRTAPDEPNLNDTLGWVYFRRGELVDAERTLNQALHLAGNGPAAAGIRDHLRQVRKGLGTSRP